MASGRAQEASRVLTEAYELAVEHGDLWWLAEVCRLTAATRDHDAAVHLLERACAIARNQGAVSLELRAATDLAVRWIGTSRQDNARELLRTVRARSAGCNREDMTAADAVLTTLG